MFKTVVWLILRGTIDEWIIDEWIIDERIIDERIIDEWIIDEWIIDEWIIDEWIIIGWTSLFWWGLERTCVAPWDQLFSLRVEVDEKYKRKFEVEINDLIDRAANWAIGTIAWSLELLFKLLKILFVVI